jgi:hypothetical protein
MLLAGPHPPFGYFLGHGKRVTIKIWKNDMRRGLKSVLAFVLFSLVWAAPAPANSPVDSSEPPLTQEHRLSIMRQLAFEYATTLQPLPASQKEKEALQVDRTGQIDEARLRQTLANRGVAVQPGEIVQVTGLEFKRDSILFEINGGGKKKKKWYQRIRIQAGGPVSGGPPPPPTSTPVPPGGEQIKLGAGSWIVLSFTGSLPDMNPDQVKQMLGGVLDFSRQSVTVPWIETIPEELRQAIEEGRVMVGMNKKMVLTALGRPDRKVREVRDGQETVDWIYGNPPFVTFVVFVGDEVVEVKEYR